MNKYSDEGTQASLFAALERHKPEFDSNYQERRDTAVHIKGEWYGRAKTAS